MYILLFTLSCKDKVDKKNVKIKMRYTVTVIYRFSTFRRLVYQKPKPHLAIHRHEFNISKRNSFPLGSVSI